MRSTKVSCLLNARDKGWTILFLRGGGGVGQFCLVENFCFCLSSFRLYTNFFPSVFSLLITKNEHFMRYAYTSMGQKMIHEPQALLSL